MIYFSKAFIHLARSRNLHLRQVMNLGVFVAEGGVGRIRTDDQFSRVQARAITCDNVSSYVKEGY